MKMMRRQEGAVKAKDESHAPAGRRKMKVYTLTGKSGTGKSFQALNLCKEYNIESIVDDGLFIYQNKVMAGTSAKREKTKVGAIKAAMFIRPEHRDEVKKSIESVQPESILVIATSDGMAEEICEQLELPEIYKVIHIEDITTEREREKAWKQRRIQGKHVIPVPSMQLKRDFAGYFGGDRLSNGLAKCDKERNVAGTSLSYGMRLF